jgi:class 3 adenylate cyclase
MKKQKKKIVSCRNINIIANYVYKNLGSDSLLLEDLPHDISYYKDENSWVTLSEFVLIMRKAIGLLKDYEAPFKMGLSAQELESWGAFKYIQKVFASVILGPIELYKQVGKYNGFFNKTKDMLIVQKEKGQCDFKVKFKNNVNPVDDFFSDAFIRGIFTSIPRIWNLPEARLEEPMLEYDLKTLLIKIGEVDESDIKFIGGRIIVRNVEIGRQVVLLPEEKKEELYLGKYREFQSDDDWEMVRWGFVITSNIEINKHLILKAGEIYNAPYFIYRISWRPLNWFQKMYQLVVKSFVSKNAYREGLESQLDTIKNYVETLEDKVLKRTEELNDAKEESEYWRGKAEDLLQTMLPENIVQKMMKERLVTEEMEGTIVFTDLAGFTAFSRDLEPEEVSRHLTEYFTAMSEIIHEHGGWVNKFLGDGILALFGLNDKEGHIEMSIKASLAMQAAMHKFPWHKRVGIATGKFITGEFGTEKTRRFDCLGHTVNLASRLQSHAEIGELLVCSDTFLKMKDKFNFGVKKQISPKGVGDISVYPLKLEDNG